MLNSFPSLRDVKWWTWDLNLASPGFNYSSCAALPWRQELLFLEDESRLLVRDWRRVLLCMDL